jgi:hypothetical protein
MLASIIPLAIGTFPEVPDDVPGVDAGATVGAGDDGIPSPGVRFVVQPNAAMERVRAAAPARRNPLPVMVVRIGVIEFIMPPYLAVI